MKKGAGHTLYRSCIFCLDFVIAMCFLFLDEALHSLCMVQNDCIDVLTKDGALFTITLPFPVAQVMSLSEGLLLERTTAPGEITGQKK